MIGPNRYYNDYFSENIVIGLHECIEKHPNIIPSTNLLDSIHLKENMITLKKHKHLIQISVRELHNDLILSVSQGRCHGARNKDDIVRIGETSLKSYIPKHINPKRNINNTTCGCETCISDMLV